MKNVTLSVSDETLAKAREAARRRGTSLNALIREYLAELAGNRGRGEAVKRLRQVWSRGGGHSGGRKVRREDAYQGRA